MKTRNQLLLLCALAIAAGLASCTGAYKSAQTPDDLYYSPGTPAKAREDASSDDGYYAPGNKPTGYYTPYSSTDDRYLRMKVADHYRFSDLDDYSYWYDSRYFDPTDPYYSGLVYSPNSFYAPGMSYYGGLGSYYGLGLSPFFSLYPSLGAYGYYGSGYGYGSYWNSLYNPYFGVVAYKNPGTMAASASSGANLKAFSNRTYNNSGFNFNRSYIDGQSSSSFGSLVRRAFSSGGSSGSNGQAGTFDRPARTFSSQPSSNNTYSAPSSNAGGRSGGYSSSGSSAGGGRAGRP